MVSATRLEAPAGLLARWGIPADAHLTRTERGCNNQTFAVAHGGGRWVLRISQNLSAAQARRLEVPAGRVGARTRATGGDLPVQVVHGDLGASNTLVDERTGEMTGVLDFELAGPEARVQDLLVGLLLSGALAGPGWARRTAALVRGYAAVLRLGQPEIMAVPDLLVTRCVGSVFSRAGRSRL